MSLIVEYTEIVNKEKHGVDSLAAKKFRQKHSGNREFINIAQKIALLKRIAPIADGLIRG
jgi:hypothetical protein